MSRHHRLAVDLAEGVAVEVSGGAAHHLERVLRVAVGDRFVGIGRDGAAWHVEVVGLRPLVVRPVEVAVVEGDPAVALEVWLPLLKGGRTDDLVRQLTELGATRIVVWCGARSVVQVPPAKVAPRVARWQAIAVEATGQCGRVEAPAVSGVAGLPEGGPGVFFWEEGAEPARGVLCALAASLGEGAPLSVLIGPEGGLTAGEAERLVAAGWRAAWLGPRILRAETAVVAAAVLALSAAGEGGY